ncbi:hypothetical protein [Owenweeksia hongkongensis]|uniref:hypothetical protein n=1 Tax=Owenweeksia hongkongensis TaxID=253245 RepID=UPI003A90139C
MKKISFFSLIVGLTVFLGSCDKDKTTDLLVKKSGSVNYVIDNVTNIPNPYPISNYMDNPEDADDEKINGHLLEISVALRNFLNTHPQNQYVFQKASASAISSINLITFINDLGSEYSGNSEFSNLATVIENADLTHLSLNPEDSGVIEQYVPAIYIPNLSNADITKQPILVAGFEVNSEMPGMEEYEDFVVAWYYDADGNLIETLLDENTVQNTSNPVFIVSNGEEETINRSREEFPLITNNKSASSTRTDFHSHEFQINHRYERSGRSEFCIASAHIDPTAVVHINLRKDNGTYDTWKEIREVEKKDIGKLLGHWEQFITTNASPVAPYGSSYTYWNTFERDWYSSAKDLGNGSGNGKTVYLAGERKYSSEWYAYNPSVVKNNRVDYGTIYSSWAKWHNNSKGKFRLWRVEL